MQRRDFLKTAAFPGIAALAPATARGGEPDSPASNLRGRLGTPEQTTWLFFDWWHIEHQDNAKLEQGVAQWEPDANYEDPTLTYLGFWPKVHRAEDGSWRMLYFGSGMPLTLLGAESADGVRWKPMNRPDIQPPGRKLAANHLFTVPSANGGPVYFDPVAGDGARFRFYCIQRGGPAAERARLDPDSYFHEIVKGEGVKPYLADARMAVSEDGLRWRLDDVARWGEAPWHPDPPIHCFYDVGRKRHVMITRPGWGDRRIAMQFSSDARHWDDLQTVLQPDALDPPQMQLYGMPVHYYEGAYVGFLWRAHFSNARRLERFNQLWGTIDAELTYSLDGRNFHRGLRTPMVTNTELGQPGAGVIYPTDLVDMEDHLRIYSVGVPDLHHQYDRTQFTRKRQEGPNAAVLLHKLRKDGFMYLASRGNWASFITKPLTLLRPGLRLNVAAPHGEVRFQFTDLLSRPIEGYTFDDGLPCRETDSLNYELAWKQRDTSDLIGRVVRLEVQFRHAHLYALRGRFHFCDALDVALLQDGKPLESAD